MAATAAAPRVEVSALESVVPPQVDVPQAGTQLSTLPAGARRSDQGFATVQVFYATDRGRGTLPLSAYEVTGQKQAFLALAGWPYILDYVNRGHPFGHGMHYFFYRDTVLWPVFAGEGHWMSPMPIK